MCVLQLVVTLGDLISCLAQFLLTLVMYDNQHVLPNYRIIPVDSTCRSCTSCMLLDINP